MRNNFLIKNNSRKFIIICAICFLTSGISFAQNINLNQEKNSSGANINLNLKGNTSSEIKINLNQKNNVDSSFNIGFSKDDYFLDITNATDKFVQRNIRASWEEFQSVIKNTTPNDFYYCILANKMAEIGFFDLADLAFASIKDKGLTETFQKSIKRFYYPANSINVDDEIFLAQIYSDVSFNNQSSEATKELLKNTKINGIDYANYLIGLGYYKSNNYKEALIYINKAIKLNPNNLNYLYLKAKIYADNGKNEDALKIVKNLKNTNINSLIYKNKILALENYVLYKTKKSVGEKNYYLGLYYYTENDYSKSLKSLQAALSDKRAPKSKIYGLISQLYFLMQDNQKASEAAKKAHRYDLNQYYATMTLGDLSFYNKIYKNAISYYKKASNKDDSRFIATIKLAKTYEKTGDIKKAKEIYEKILKQNPYNSNAHYELGLLDDSITEKNMRKAVEYNIYYANAWAELAKAEISKKNYDLAMQYLADTYYIDENNFKYYYYQGLLNKDIKDFAKAKYHFKKCLKINPGNPAAERELKNIIKQEQEEQ